jgi:ribonuclease BN (tRNA processing enzyme)
MDITILGSGTGIPSAKRGSPGIFVRLEKEGLLIDAGPGTCRQLTCAGFNTNDVDCVLLTHLHPDHANDLVPFFFAARHGESRTKTLTLIGPRGFKLYHERLMNMFGEWVASKSYSVVVKEMLKNELKREGWVLSSGQMYHEEFSVGYRIESGGKVFVYTGDTDYHKNVVKLAQNADLLVAECSFPDGAHMEGHMTPELVGRLAKEANAKRMVLVHMYPQCENTDIITQVKKVWTGDFALGEDLMKLTV